MAAKAADYGQSAPLPALRRDEVVDPSDLRYRNPSYTIWFHPDVDSVAREHPHVGKKLCVVLEMLAAHGRTSCIKACSDANSGWLRSPMGGSGGMQFYLWWTRSGAPPVKGFDLNQGDIVVRAIRNHDNHDLLSAGSLDDYFPYNQRDIAHEGAPDIVKPWTGEQMRFIRSEEPVRVLYGRPGSGKTMALWKAIEARTHQRVLYLTWSQSLADLSQERFQTFADTSLMVTAMDFTTFLGILSAKDFPRQTISESREHFVRAISNLHTRQLGPWADRKEALFAEVRAYLVGRALPECVDMPASGLVRSQASASALRLSDEAYEALRARQDSGIGKEAVDALVRILSVIGQESLLPAVFPELAAAFAAIQRLNAGQVPDSLGMFDRIVVDEVQDLTLLEFAVVVEFCRYLQRMQGKAPYLLVAGDEGQTVRPTGFDWGALSTLIGQVLGKPETFDLQEPLRCPARIESVIEALAMRYGNLNRRLRPGRQSRAAGDVQVESRIFYVEAGSVQLGRKLLEYLGSLDHTCIISPHDRLPDWIPAELEQYVHGPEDAKGHEFQTVAVLDPGSLLVRLDDARNARDQSELEEQLCRTGIDRFRVAVSRATDALLFIDVVPGERERRFSLELLDHPLRLDPVDLVEHFKNPDRSPAEKVLAKLEKLRADIDEYPARAWENAEQAVSLLGDPASTDGVPADDPIRAEARMELVKVAVRLLVQGLPEKLRRQDIIAAAVRCLDTLQEDSIKAAFAELDAWLFNPDSSPIRLLNTIHAAGTAGFWMRRALAPMLQRLSSSLEAAASDPVQAPRFDAKVESWLETTGYGGDVAAEARRLRLLAVDCLLVEGAPQNLPSVERILKSVVPEVPELTGKVDELQGRFESAAQAYLRAGASADALRVWRKAARWEDAIAVAEGAAQEQLQWLLDLDTLVKACPPRLMESLNDKEKKRLRQILGSVETKGKGAG